MEAQTLLLVLSLFAIPALGAWGVLRLGHFRTAWTLAALVYYLVAWVVTLGFGFLGVLQSPRTGGWY